MCRPHVIAGQVVNEYRVDVGLLRAMRAVLKQAAQELGQWGQPLETPASRAAAFTIVSGDTEEWSRERPPAVLSMRGAMP